MNPTIASASDGIKIKKVSSHQKTKSTRMNQYNEFCRLRDHRKPGAEVPQYTEAEAFALAASKCKTCDHAIAETESNE